MKTKTFRPTLADLKAERPLTGAEERLIDACKTGVGPVFDSARPQRPDDSNEIRAELIRYLLLGGCQDARSHPKGVKMWGAYVTGRLDMEGCRTHLSLFANASTFAETPVLQDADLGFLGLAGSQMPGLEGHRVRIERGCLLSQGFRSSGPVDVSSARIGQTLVCDGGTFDGAGERALDCGAMRVDADVFLSGKFTAKGEVNLRGARIVGQLACSGGTFDGAGGGALDCNAIRVGTDVFLSDGFTAEGEVNFVGARIGGQLACVGGTFDGADGSALNCQAMRVGADVFLHGDFTATGGVDFTRAEVTGHLQIVDAELRGDIAAERLKVSGTFFWQGVSGRIPIMDLEDAHFGKLDDDRESWGIVEHYLFDGLTYDATGPAISARARIDWLAKNRSLPDRDDKGTLLPSFAPQPYSQLAKVMDAQGHRRAAARVLFEREKRLRRADHRRAHARVKGDVGSGWESITADLRWLGDQLFRLLFGYGHKPLRGLLAALIFVVLAGGLFGGIYNRGQMAPASDVVLTSAEWLAAVNADAACPLRGASDRRVKIDAGCDMTLDIWAGTASSAIDYETFNRWLYGLDLFVPLDALGQENAWAPSKDRGWWGFAGYYLRWFFQLMGWVITALGAATLTGLVGRRD